MTRPSGVRSWRCTRVSSTLVDGARRFRRRPARLGRPGSAPLAVGASIAASTSRLTIRPRGPAAGRATAQRRSRPRLRQPAARPATPRLRPVATVRAHRLASGWPATSSSAIAPPSAMVVALGDEPAQDAGTLGLVGHRRLVGLDLDELVAALDLVAVGLQPVDDRRPPPSSRTAAASTTTVASSRARTPRTGSPGSGYGAASARSSPRSSCASTSDSIASSASADDVEALLQRARRRPAAGRARCHASSSPGLRYLPGSLREWPTKRYVSASMNDGPAAGAGALGRLAPRPRARPRRPFRPPARASIAQRPRRAMISPAVTSSHGVNSP